jgi:hypothetical protein
LNAAQLDQDRKAYEQSCTQENQQRNTIQSLEFKFKQAQQTLQQSRDEVY